MVTEGGSNLSQAGIDAHFEFNVGILLPETLSNLLSPNDPKTLRDQQPEHSSRLRRQRNRLPVFAKHFFERIECEPVETIEHDFSRHDAPTFLLLEKS
jgi:hypothetical protein